MTDIACPACGTEFDVAAGFACAADGKAFERLVEVGIPMGDRVAQYLLLFQPLKQRLTTRKKVKLLLQLLPDLERQAITWKGRDWAAPHAAWAQAIDQMLAARDRLELPMKGHGYLYAVLSGMADKAEATAEQQREQDHRQRPLRDTVQVRGQAMEFGTALEVVYGGKDPALAAIEQQSRNASPIPADVRARMAEIKKGRP